LQFEDGMVEMKAGDFINIPANKKHRVDWTTPDEPTVWLGVRYGRCRRSPRAKTGENAVLGAGCGYQVVEEGGAFHDNEGCKPRDHAVPVPSRERPPP
jgi:hypothetical protein